ncbi:TPA: hypothetical protein EYO77_12145, partial [Candidatus Poribacteria bacterium]|nr:hypothetical protein [Candidatus Poribacteria bacterium]
MNSYHVKNVRHQLKNDNRSISDYAFLKELAREGILDTQVWKYALITTPGTKFDRDRDLAYVETTVNNLWQEVSSTGIFLDQAQKQLAQEFDHININGQQIIVCEAKVGTGKTFNAVRKVQQAVEQDISVIVLVPTHALANEWEKLLDLKQGKSVVRLYGISHPEVGCPHNTKQNISLMKTGHSTLFRQKYCASCPLQENCKHLQSVNLAPESDVLVAQHRHLNLFPGFLQTQHGNRDRTLVVIDEMPELVNVEKISANDIQQNIQLFQQLVETESNPDLENVIEVLSQLKEAHHHRQNIQLSHEAINKLHHVDFEHLNQMIVNHYTNNNQQPNGRNLLWDLFNLGILKAKLEYVKDPGSKDERDVLIYRWTPNFNHKTALILSGTVKSEYIERQINQSVRPMAENWSIIRKNLKVVQLMASASGRSRLQAKI